MSLEGGGRAAARAKRAPEGAGGPGPGPRRTGRRRRGCIGAQRGRSADLLVAVPATSALFIKALTLSDATFSVRELETYLTKHSLPYATVMDATEAVLAHPDVVKLYDPATGEHTGLYTARNVYEIAPELTAQPVPGI
jgi:hypothetical protein